jgi:Zn ribbon nucleic-acid-binding protein
VVGDLQFAYQPSTMPDIVPIRVNRGPVLTLWATIVAERLDHSPDTALTLWRFVAGSDACAKARSLGIADEPEEAAERREGVRCAHVRQPGFNRS